MTTRLVIDVTQKDIDLGIRSSCHLCPIARALLRGTDHSGTRVAVGYEGIIVQHGPVSVTYKPSARAATFIHRFDTRGKEAVKPARFALQRLP